MATWVAPIDSQTDPDAPLTSELGKRWDNNVIAAFEGAADAVRLHGDAVGTIANGGLPVLTVTADSAYVADDESFITTLGTLSTTSTSDVVAKTYEDKLYSGSMRFFATQRTNGTGTSDLTVYKNNVLQGGWSHSSSTSAGRAIDLTVAVDDVVEWRHRASGGGTSIISGIEVRADETYQRVIPMGRASQLVVP